MTTRVALVMAPMLSSIRTGAGNRGGKYGGSFRGGKGGLKVNEKMLNLSKKERLCDARVIHKSNFKPPFLTQFVLLLYLALIKDVKCVIMCPKSAILAK